MVFFLYPHAGTKCFRTYVFTYAYRKRDEVDTVLSSRYFYSGYPCHFGYRLFMETDLKPSVGGAAAHVKKTWFGNAYKTVAR